MNIAHKTLNVSAELHDFNQAGYETYHTALMQGVEGKVSSAVANGAVVKAAIEAGILTGVQVGEVGEMKPAAVIWLTKKIHLFVEETVTVPPE